MGSPVGLALVGAAGRMGLEITRVAALESDLSVVGAVERTGSSSVGRDLGELAGVGCNGVALVDDVRKIDREFDVIIDLSLPGATELVIEGARAVKKPLVCGTTGLSPNTMNLFDEAASEIPVLYTPNLSLGIAVTNQLVAKAVEALGGDYDVEIVEMHHRNKGDAPSGTAMALAKTAAEAKGLDADHDLCFGRAGSVGARSIREIGVHAVRGGGVFGEHKIILAGEHDQIEITHRASSRTLFAKGALAAARFLHDKPKGLYDMAQMLFR